MRPFSPSQQSKPTPKARTATPLPHRCDAFVALLRLPCARAPSTTASGATDDAGPTLSSRHGCRAHLGASERPQSRRLRRTHDARDQATTTLTVQCRRRADDTATTCSRPRIRALPLVASRPPRAPPRVRASSQPASASHTRRARDWATTPTPLRPCRTGHRSSIIVQKTPPQNHPRVPPLRS